MVLRREIIRCFRFNPDTLEYECERVYNSEIDDLRGLRDFLDAYNVKEVKHIIRTYSNGFPIITVFRDLFRYSVRNVKETRPMNDA